jgi:hypothetical protein
MPAGTRLVRRPSLVEGQRITFCVWSGDSAKISYLARVSGKGRFTWEPALMSHYRAPSIRALSPSSQIEVR